MARSQPPPFLEILPTRVRRTYTGGALLEAWTGDGPGTDGDRPEDWIASTTAAANPGLPAIPGEGLTVLRHGRTVRTLPEWIAGSPEYYLGRQHLDAHGPELGFLAKLLDSAIRLHVQAHPTSRFARRHLGSRYGKLETYVILAIREGTQPYLRLGFQRAPTRPEWRRIIAEQDIPAMDACFDPIPLQVGDVWRVPGGMPHAIGEGVLMLEVMEPSDLVVRCEFVREGIVVPAAGRFMGRDLDFCLRIFDCRSRSVEEIRRRCRLQPRAIGPYLEELVGPAHTDCFRIHRETYPAAAVRPGKDRLELLLVAAGAGDLECGGKRLALRPSTRLLLPASARPVSIRPSGPSPLQILSCHPAT
jgi:mannose-6-phosphate isomerase